MRVRHDSTERQDGRTERAAYAERGPAAPDTLLDVAFEAGTVLRRRWRWIAATTLGAIVLAFVFLAMTPPLYRSGVQVLIDPRAKQVLQTEVVPSGLGQSSMGADTLLVDSQIDIMLSNAVLRRVVDSEGLAHDPEFAKPEGPGLSSLFVGVGVAAAPDASQWPRRQPPEQAAIETLRKRLEVKRRGNTYVVSIATWSRNPQRAANLADAVAAAYLEEDRNAVRTSTRQTTEALRSRLDELREQVDEANGRVADYRDRHDLIGVENVLVSDQQLRDLNNQLTSARTRSAEARASYETLTQVAEDGIPGAESMSEAIASDTLTGLRVAYGDVVRQMESAVATLGPAHPRLRQLAAEERGLQQQIQAELDRLVRGARRELDVALGHERSLAAELERLEERASDSNRNMVRLRQLEREAEAAQEVYEAFLHRTRQSAEQEGISTNNARVISAATVPVRHTYPPARLVGIAAIVVGIIFGCLFAWGHHIATLRRQPSSKPLAMAA